MNYDTKKKICYGLAKYLGIASYAGINNELTLVIPKSMYVYDREHDDDRWYEYEKICGTQIYPFNKNWLKYNEIELIWDSVYRDYIKQRISK